MTPLHPQDILENESITLDWMFRYSLTNDIIKVTSCFPRGSLWGGGTGSKCPPCIRPPIHPPIHPSTHPFHPILLQHRGFKPFGTIS